MLEREQWVEVKKNEEWKKLMKNLMENISKS